MQLAEVHLSVRGTTIQLPEVHLSIRGVTIQLSDKRLEDWVRVRELVRIKLDHAALPEVHLSVRGTTIQLPDRGETIQMRCVTPIVQQARQPKGTQEQISPMTSR